MEQLYMKFVTIKYQQLEQSLTLRIQYCDSDIDMVHQ